MSTDTDVLDGGHRLPRTVVPERYDLTLSPDIPAATFTGEERVLVEILEPVSRIVLNAIDLEILEAELTSAGGEELTGTVALDDEHERATIALSGTAEPGAWTLHLTFRGTLNDKLKGFYRSRFTDSAGVEHELATTQFEATDARRAFPCWDEPDRKAVFAVTLVVDEDLLAVSNSPVIEETDLGNGKRQVTFADSMKMSTYLVAFVVGPLVATEPVDVDGVPLRIICAADKLHLTDYALESGAHSLRFFTKYFGIPYPGGKLDLIAIPDFAAGAMENLGAVTFREAVLLIDRAAASRTELQRVADVIAHEIAHMWFGDLVTMKWWNGIWLNEAFATFMEMLAVDDFQPGWERWVAFGRTKAVAMVTDGLAATRTIEYPVGPPSDADGMFDSLTYEKGAAVLRMLEQHIGGDEFRTGIREYLGKYAYGNTETEDLWDAIEAATSEPARSIMDSWIFQEGYPLVTVSNDGARVSITQQRFRYDGADDPTLWQVPVAVRADTPTGEVHHRTLLTARSGAVDLEGAAKWVVANEGGAGFYRVRYSTELLRAITADLNTVMSPLERLNLVNDTWASALAGLGPVSDFLELCARLVDESDPNVWAMATEGLDAVRRALDAETQARFATWARGVLRPPFDRLGFAPTAADGDGAGERQAILLSALGTWAADEEIRGAAADLHARYLNDRAAIVPDLVPAVVTVVASNGDSVAYDQHVARWKQPATPQEETRYLYSLAQFREPALVARTLHIALNEARTQNAPFLVQALLGNTAGQRAAWEFVEANWDEIIERFPGNILPRMVAPMSVLDPDLVERGSAFLRAHPLPGHEKQIDQVLERGRINVAFRAREAEKVAAFLAQA